MFDSSPTMDELTDTRETITMSLTELARPSAVRTI